MKYFKFFNFFILLATLLLAGCISSTNSRHPVSSMHSTRKLAQDLIEQDWHVFVRFPWSRFRERISRDFQPDKNVFVNNAQDALASAVPVSLSFTVDKALTNDEKLAVTITWQRKIADRNTGDLTLDEGKCTIVYLKEAMGWRIYQVQGSSIFAF